MADFVTEETFEVAQENAHLRTMLADERAQNIVDRKIVDTYTVQDSKFSKINEELKNIAIHEAHETERFHALELRVCRLEKILGELTTYGIAEAKVIPTPTP